MSDPSDPPTATKAYQPPMRLAMTLFILLCIFRLGLVAGRPMAFYAGGTYDDQLFVQHAHQIERGNWLGHYNQLTLIKGPGLPLLIAAQRLIGVSYSFGTQLLWCATCTLLLFALTRLGRNALQFWMLFVIAGCVLFHPSSWAGMDAAVKRDAPLYMAQTLAVFSGGLLIIFAADRHHQLKWGIFTGLALGWFWITREEGVWIVPSLGLLAAWILVASWRSQPRTAGAEPKRRRNVLRTISVAAVPILTACFINYMVCTINYIRYKVFCVVELKNPDFLAAYGALARIDPENRIHYVPVSAEARELAYSVSPTFRRLRPLLEGDVGKAWAYCSAAYLPPQFRNEIGGGHFVWALRDAVFDTFKPKNGAQAMKIYRAIGKEITAAIDAGAIPAGSRHDTLAPPVQWSDWRALVGSAQRGASALIASNLISMEVGLSSGAQSQLNLFKDMLLTEPTPTQQGKQIMISGWVFDAKGRPVTMRLTPSAASSPPLRVQWHQSPDVADLPQAKDIASSKRARFQLDGWAKTENKLIFSVDGKKIATLDYEHGKDSMNGPNIYASLDSISFSDQFGLTTRPDQKTLAHHLFDIRQAEFVGYKLVQPYFFWVGVLAFLATIVAAFRRRPGAVAFALMAIVVLTALFMRVALLAYIDALSFPAINGLYLAPAYPLIPLFAGLSICGATCWFAFAKKQYRPLEHVRSYPTEDAPLGPTTLVRRADGTPIGPPIPQ